ncbi:MAG: hypothetical protein AB1445_13265 [Bacillota bacterium]
MARTRILVVGVCTSGKTTLVDALRRRGYDAYCVAQEHSSVSRLWALRSPDLVVCLDVSYEAAVTRRKVFWGPERLQRQRDLLEQARARADIYLDTTGLTPGKVLSRVLEAISERGDPGGAGDSRHDQTTS